MTLRRILALLALVPLVFMVCIAEEGAGETERNLSEEPLPPEKEKECPCDDEPKNRCVYTKISLGATSGEHEKFNVNSLGDSFVISDRKLDKLGGFLVDGFIK